MEIYITEKLVNGQIGCFDLDMRLNKRQSRQYRVAEFLDRSIEFRYTDGQKRKKIVLKGVQAAAKADMATGYNTTVNLSK